MVSVSHQVKPSLAPFAYDEVLDVVQIIGLNLSPGSMQPHLTAKRLSRLMFRGAGVEAQMDHAPMEREGNVWAHRRGRMGS